METDQQHVPSVVSVMVVHEPGEWFDETLASLAAQDYANLRTLFLVTLRPDVGGTEDSPKFQFLGQVLGTAHTPGYPFYTIATYLFTRVPIGTLAYRVNLFSAVCGVLSGVFSRYQGRIAWMIPATAVLLAMSLAREGAFAGWRERLALLKGPITDRVEPAFLRFALVGAVGFSVDAVVLQALVHGVHHRPIRWARAVKKMPLGFSAGRVARRAKVAVS